MHRHDPVTLRRGRVVFSATLLLALASTAADPAGAQVQPVSLVERPPWILTRHIEPRQQRTTQPPIGNAIVGGVLGGALAGGVAYVLFGGLGDCRDLCGLGLAYAVGVGTFVGLPLGVHLGNRRRGNFLVDLFLSTAAGAAAYALLKDRDDSAAILMVPVLQLAVTVSAERLMGRR